MYNPGKYRIYAIMSLLVFIVAVLLLSGIIWNAYLKSDKIFAMVWPVILILMLLIAISAIFVIAYNLTDTGALNGHVENIVRNERIRILKEIEDKKENENEIEKQEINIENIIDTITPDSKTIKTIEAYAGSLLSNFANKFDMVQGLCYIANKEEFGVAAKFAFTGDHVPERFKTGITLPGQAAQNKELMVVGEIPDNYFPVKSGLGGSMPRYLLFFPLVHKNKTIAIFELASFKKVDDSNISIIKQLSEILGEKLAKFNK